MADKLNMNGLSLQDSQHAPQAGGPPQQNGFGGRERAAYIPPHMRQQRGGPPPAGPPGPAPNGFDGGPPPMGNGMNARAWAPPPGQK